MHFSLNLEAVIIVMSTFLKCLNCGPRVAIVGAGIGGASSGYFLSQLLPEAEITIFEENDIGGRLAIERVNGRMYEYGGSIIHGGNQLMVEYLNLCGLKRKQSPENTPMTLHKDGQIVFQEWGYGLIDKLRLLYRYGLWSLFKLDNFVQNLLKNFKSIYSKLAKGHSYETVEDLLISMGPVSKSGENSEEMVNLTRVSLNDKLVSLGINDRLIEELVTVATRVNYGQMPKEMHAFVGAVGLAGVDGDLWAVEGGNVQVVKCAIEMSKATVMHRKVIKIIDSKKTLKVQFESGVEENDFSSMEYDIVIVATPLTADKSNITILPSSPKFPGSFHTTVATVVEGELIPPMSEDYFTTTNFYLSPDNFLVSIARLSPVDYDPTKDKPASVFKIFSTRSLTRTELSALFSDIKSVKVTPWLAYPSYSVNMDLSTFILSPGLYYTNRIEFAASAMEMSAIGAKNVANLAFKYWKEKMNTDLDQNDVDNIVDQNRKVEL